MFTFPFPVLYVTYLYPIHTAGHPISGYPFGKSEFTTGARLILKAFG